MNEKISAQAQAALNEFYKSSTFSVTVEKQQQMKAEYKKFIIYCGDISKTTDSLAARAMLYQNLAIIPFIRKGTITHKAAHMISELPIDVRFTVLKAIDAQMEFDLKQEAEITTCHKADEFRKIARCLEDTIFSDKAVEIASIIATLPYDKQDELLGYILSC